MSCFLVGFILPPIESPGTISFYVRCSIYFLLILCLIVQDPRQLNTNPATPLFGVFGFTLDDKVVLDSVVVPDAFETLSSLRVSGRNGLVREG